MCAMFQNSLGKCTFCVFWVLLPIEKIGDDEPFLRKARESFYIKLFNSQKMLPVTEIEHGLNLDKGQWEVCLGKLLICTI